MPKELRFDGKVAIITGAGGGLGRTHALLLASRGARVVVNDLGGSATGAGKSSAAADRVVEEIRAAGGEAVANYDSVEDGAKIVQTALDTWGRIDIVVNNAGILRDTTFHKMSQEDWDLIYRVHVLGSFRVTHAAWPHMRDQGYGRVVMTASAAGIYGNFGQANYSMAKLGLVGLSNTLAVEGKKKNVNVNTIAPIAGSRLTETILPKELTDALKPEYVSPLVAWLCHEECKDTGGLYELGGGFFSKLRWERSEGATMRLGRPMTIEAVANAWNQITSFEKSTHPPDVNASMAPVMTNIQSGPSKGGNDLIDVDQALGYEFPPMTSSYDERDLAIYALSVGAAQNPLDQKDLRFVYELHGDGFLALPTFGVIPAINAVMSAAKEGKTAPGMNYGIERLLHGEQYTEVKRPLPAKAKLTHKARIKDIFDKDKNAVIVTAVRTYDESGEELIYNELTSVIRGAGGWGGDRGPAGESNAAPDRAPDAVIEEKTAENQALFYRLTGDWNPLHADPSFASAFGYPKPILHGLCTFGFAGRHVIKAFLDGDPRKFKGIKVRFAESVFPGETLVTEMWRESDTKIVLRCKVKERDKVVISNASVELYKEIPQPKAKAAPAKTAGVTTPPAGVPAESDKVTSADVFVAIQDHLEKNPALSAKTKTLFQFKLTDPASAYAIDLKSDPGKVIQGDAAGPDVTLELSEADFIAMSTGKADPQKLYFEKKLKISGNLMASQKLMFLKEIDPEAAKKAVLKRRNAGGSVVNPPEASASDAPSASAEGTSADVFIAIQDHLEKHPELVGKTKAVFQFKLSDPASAYAIDLKSGDKGKVIEGTVDGADTTLELSNADFIAMATGKADANKLYFGGKLKISGNVMASQKLMFLKEIDPEAAKKAVLAKKSASAPAEKKPAAAAAPSAKQAQAPAIFEKLGARLAEKSSLASEVGAIVQFRVMEPESLWVADLSGKGEVRQGRDAKAAAVITIADADLVGLVKGTESAQRLYQSGKMRVDGDVTVAHRLGFLKGLV